MENPRILIVDDDIDLVKALEVILRSEQYDVSIATDKETGMEKLRIEKPDLLILDVMMSTWQDGFEIARALKKEDGLRDMPILMLTGVKERTGVDFKSSAGDSVWLPVDAFLDKPVEPEVLLEKIKELLSKAK